MTIKRTVNGVETEYVLTYQERLDTYYEMQHSFDKSDITAEVECMSDAQFFEKYEVQKSDFLAIIDDVAYEMRRNIDKYDMSWDYARDDAILWGVDVIRDAQNESN